MNSGVIVDQGEVGASSTFMWNDSGYTYRPANAFKASKSEVWGNEYDQFPVFIWKRYRTAHRLQKIGFRVPQFEYNWPNVFEIVGSNNGLHWTTMLRIDNQGGFTANDQFRTFIIPVEKRAPFRRLGLKWPKKDGSNGCVSLNEITMWEE